MFLSRQCPGLVGRWATGAPPPPWPGRGARCVGGRGEGTATTGGTAASPAGHSLGGQSFTAISTGFPVLNQLSLVQNRSYFD